ncbi:hypothetical protein ABZP36_027973 [Zizania latifolia]
MSAAVAEVERHLVAQADLEPEESPRLAPLRGCILVLSSHRLIFLHETSRSARAPARRHRPPLPSPPQAQPQPPPLHLPLLVLVAPPAHPPPDLPATLAIGGRRRHRHWQGGCGCVLREASRVHPREGLGGKMACKPFIGISSNIWWAVNRNK